MEVINWLGEVSESILGLVGTPLYFTVAFVLVAVGIFIASVLLGRSLKRDNTEDLINAIMAGVLGLVFPFAWPLFAVGIGWLVIILIVLSPAVALGIYVGKKVN